MAKEATCYKIKSGGTIDPKYGMINWLDCRFATEGDEPTEHISLYPTTNDAEVIADDVIRILGERRGWVVGSQARMEFVFELADALDGLWVRKDLAIG